MACERGDLSLRRLGPKPKTPADMRQGVGAGDPIHSHTPDQQR